jgi:stress response protein YsnF
MQTAAYVSTYSQALHDFNAQTGQSVAQFESQWEKGFARFKANFQQSVVNGLTGNASWGEILLGPVWSGAFGNRDQRQQADAKASEAEQLAGQMFTLTRQLAAKSAEWAEMEAQIAEYRRIAKDDSEGLAAQQNAIAQAEDLIAKRYDDEYNIRKQMSDLQTKMVGLTGSSVAEEDKMYQMQAQAAAVMRQKETLLKSLNRDQKTLNSAVAAEAEARRKAAEQAEKERQVMAQRSAQLAGLNIGGTSYVAPNKVKGPEGTILLHPKVDNKEVIDLSKEIASLVEQGTTSAAESIGSLIGDLATGGDAWNNFANAAVSSFGDMAISVGKMAIATGTATLGIKAALESLNGYVAIAAGAALIALGAAVKTGMSNIASGNYSASSSVASSGYSTATLTGGGYRTSSINIRVSGTLVGDGNQLKAVIDSENSRRNTVT